MELILLGVAVLAIIGLLLEKFDQKAKLKEKDSAIWKRDGLIDACKQLARQNEETIAGLKEKLDDAHAELIKYIRPRGAGGKFVGKVATGRKQ